MLVTLWLLVAVEVLALVLAVVVRVVTKQAQHL
jgi:hypothetical protein